MQAGEGARVLVLEHNVLSSSCLRIDLRGYWSRHLWEYVKEHAAASGREVVLISTAIALVI